jgi:ring-1,2-phenylacetyl-CoA epoxidase subunit PaaB
MESLDPRLRRLDLLTEAPPTKEQLDQLPTYEVFVQAKEPRPYKHEGCVHANSLAMALIFAKEQFSRRGMCSGIWVVDTRDIMVTDYTDNETDIYERISGKDETGGEEYAIFHMIKRGTQHSFAGVVKAGSVEEALQVAKESIERKKPVLNAWVMPNAKLLKTGAEDREMWETTPKKLFREAIDYKTQEKLNEFKSKQ